MQKRLDFGLIWRCSIALVSSLLMAMECEGPASPIGENFTPNRPAAATDGPDETVVEVTSDSLITTTLTVTTTGTISPANTSIPTDTPTPPPPTITPTPVEIPTETPAPATATTQPDLYILQEGSALETYIIAGDDAGNYAVSEALVVYTTLETGFETPIALVRIIAQNPKSLLVQTILVHPDYSIRPNLRLDGQIDKLSTSELIPSLPFAIGYLLSAGRVRIRPDATLDQGMLLQALEPDIIDGAIVDYLPFNPPIEMRIQTIGIIGNIARVELVRGDDWPAQGTLIVLGQAAPAPRPTSTPTVLTPTPKIPTATSETPTSKPTPTAAPVVSRPVPILHEPQENQNLSDNSVTFSWDWAGELAADETFEVRIWRGDSGHFGAHDALNDRQAIVRDGNRYALPISLPGAHSIRQMGNGPYFWSVAVVKIDPYGDIGLEATPRPILISIFGSGGGSSGSGDGAPTPPPAPDP